MAAPPVTANSHQPRRAFALPLRRVPRRARLYFLVAYRTAAGYLRHDGLSWSAAIAFWLVLSLPPLLIALSSLLAAAFGHETARTVLAEQVASQLPTGSFLIEDLVKEEVPLLSVAGLGSLAFLLFSASRVFGALVTAINVMYRHVERESVLRRLARRALLLFTIGVLLLGSVLLQLAFAGSNDNGPTIGDIAARYVLPFVLVTAGIFLTYLLVPHGRVRWRTALIAALVAALLLRASQFVFWFLLTGYIDFETGYGPLAGIAVLMTWAVVAAAIVLIGAELAAVLDRHRIRQEAEA